MNKLSTTVAIFAASLLAIPAAHAFQWDDVEDAAESVGSKIESGWEKVEDSIFPETEEERREEARERASDAREEAEEEAAKRRGEHPVVN
jgi:hypothetical protein